MENIGGLNMKKVGSQPKVHKTPFASCGACPYGADGFICYTCEGDCMKTRELEMEKKKKGSHKNEVK